MICTHCGKKIYKEDSFVKENNPYLENYFYHESCKEEININNEIILNVLKRSLL